MLARVLAIIISIILTSCYYFPFDIVSGVNLKMLMAAGSIAILGMRFLRQKETIIDKSFLVLSLWGVGVSLASIAATIYNNTQDYSYLSYAISMWVWMGGAYTLIKCIEWLNGKVSVEIVCNYIIAVCALQCVLAYMIDMYPQVENIIYMISPNSRGVADYADGRLWSLGCAFDVAGIRLSCGLVISAFMLYRTLQKEDFPKIQVVLYFVAFAVIAIFGNMISRTTIVGCGLFIVYLFVQYFLNIRAGGYANRRLFYSFLLCLLIAIPAVKYLYNTDAAFRSYFRFGFEGFFSLVEKGEWDVESNDILWTMYRFPETLKTWIIGDGYMLSANDDPYYTGPIYLGYYKGTDVGYLRFIYYFGIVGLIPCVMQMITAASIGVKRLPEYKIICLLLLLVNFICWFKVSTDAFSVLAIFAVYGMMRFDNESVTQNV